MDHHTRAPKLLGDFGEGLVTYALTRSGFEVACVDHVGADLIAEKDRRRIAVSVKTRLYRKGTRETRGLVLRYDDIEKLEHFAARFSLEPYFAHAACIADDNVIHLFILRVQDIKHHLVRVKHGYRLRFSKVDLPAIAALPYVHYSSWSNETISCDLFGRCDSIEFDQWIQPTRDAVTRMAAFASRFRNEPLARQSLFIDDGTPVQDKYEEVMVHPACDAFLDAIHQDGWVMMCWDYQEWYRTHQSQFRSPKWIATLSIRQIQKWLTYFSRELRGSSACIPRSVTMAISSGVLPAIVNRVAVLSSEYAA